MLTLSNTDDIIMERVRQSDALGEVSERFMVPVLKTGEGQTSVGSNPTFSAIEVKNFYFYLKSFFLKESTAWRSTQVAEGAPLEREQVVNSGARVQIPPSPLILLGKNKA